MKRVFFLVLLSVPYFLCAAAVTAEQCVRETLAASGIRVGADASRGRYVFVASADATISDPANDPQFMVRRSRLAKVAELQARSDLLKAVRMTVDLRESLTEQADALAVKKSTEAFYSIFAKKDNIRGMSVISSAESWDAASGLYQVAVAVGWNRNKSDSSILTVKQTESAVDIDSAYETWARGVNLASVVGARWFRDAQGRRLCAGVGVADIEGKSGVLLKVALRKAQLQAKANLSFAVHSDEACHDVAQLRMSEHEDANTVASDAVESFVSQVERKSGSAPLRAHEVYSTAELKHPVTGRRMYISVYGIEP